MKAETLEIVFSKFLSTFSSETFASIFFKVFACSQQTADRKKTINTQSQMTKKFCQHFIHNLSQYRRIFLPYCSSHRKIWQQIVVNVIQIWKIFMSAARNEKIGFWNILKFPSTWPWIIHKRRTRQNSNFTLIQLTPQVPSPACGIVNPLLNVTCGTLTILRVEKNT